MFPVVSQENGRASWQMHACTNQPSQTLISVHLTMSDFIHVRKTTHSAFRTTYKSPVELNKYKHNCQWIFASQCAVGANVMHGPDLEHISLWR
eukprot:m.815126 g.815126  ORF g.815126 m.815126 type:complete len:93 (-) comp23394_c0_seq37:1385-1663(-)